MKNKEQTCEKCGEKGLKIVGMLKDSNKMIYNCIYCGHNQFYNGGKNE